MQLCAQAQTFGGICRQKLTHKYPVSAAGWRIFGYDLAADCIRCRTISTGMPMTTLAPGLTLGLYATVLALTCARAALSSLRPACPKQTPKPDAGRPESEIAHWQNCLDTLADSAKPAALSDAPMRAGHAPQSNFAAQDFRNTVTQVVERILDGEIFQANIAQRFHGRLDPTDTGFGYYQRLRRVFACAVFSICGL